jgi:tetratricopeptide (TPR) repeat protein
MVMLDKKDFSAARRVFEGTRRKFPGWLLFSEQSIYDHGHRYMNDGDIPSALEIFRIYVQAYPQSWYSFDSLASACMKSGNRKEAIDNYKKVLELDPNNEGAKMALADLNAEH